jgi:hypothetical protein
LREGILKGGRTSLENINFSGEKVQKERMPDERENRGMGGLSVGRGERITEGRKGPRKRG